MNRFPAEFADLLTRKGRRILEGRDAATRDALRDPARFFVPIRGAVDPDRARAAHALLDRRMRPALSPLAAAIPPGSISNQTRNYQERLPKAVRARTAFLERRTGKAWRTAEAIGLVAMMRSASYRAFAETVAGKPLAATFGQQVLCYGPGDYAGPHTDHHPEDPAAASGYVDFHVSFGGEAVAHQYLVYARDGHFTEMVDVNTRAGSRSTACRSGTTRRRCWRVRAARGTRAAGSCWGRSCSPTRSLRCGAGGRHRSRCRRRTPGRD